MKEIIIFGDSIFKGIYFDGEAQRYRQCREKLEVSGAEVLLRCRMGATIEQGLAAIERSLPLCCSENLAVLEYGGNDCNFDWAEVSRDPLAPHLANIPIDSFRSLYLEAAQRIRDTGARLIISSLPPISAPLFMDFLSRGLDYDGLRRFIGPIERLSTWQQEYSQVAQEIAERTGALFMDLRTAVSFLPERGMISADGLHPDPAGHRLIRNYLSDYLSALV